MLFLAVVLDFVLLAEIKSSSITGITRYISKYQFHVHKSFWFVLNYLENIKIIEGVIKLVLYGLVLSFFKQRTTYTRKNAQVVTGLQTSCYRSANKLLQICSQAVNKLCPHCLFPVVVTSLEQAVNNLYQA